MNKAFKIEIIVLAVTLTILVFGIYFAVKSYNEKKRADELEKKMEGMRSTIAAKYTFDSLNLVEAFEVKLKKKDSTIIYTNLALSRIKPIIKYYDAKIKYYKTAPMSDVDKQFDSLLTVLRNRFHR